jgi:hypothetical protein
MSARDPSSDALIQDDQAELEGAERREPKQREVSGAAKEVDGIEWKRETRREPKQRGGKRKEAPKEPKQREATLAVS